MDALDTELSNRDAEPCVQRLSQRRSGY